MHLQRREKVSANRIADHARILASSMNRISDHTRVIASSMNREAASSLRHWDASEMKKPALA